MRKFKLLYLFFFCLRLLPAQELSFPPKINFFQHSRSASGGMLYEIPNARVWGWSNNGKVAYSIERQVDGRGGQKIDFIILDLITDDTVFELNMDSFDCNDAEDEALYNLFRANISNALRTNGIVQESPPFSAFPLARNNMTYNSQIINIERKNYDFGFETIILKYTVLVTADSKSKIIGNFAPVNTVTGYVYVCGYILSPFENRALVVIAEEHWGNEGTELTYRFSGCNLGVGFN